MPVFFCCILFGMQMCMSRKETCVCLYSFHMRSVLVLFVIMTLIQKVTVDDLYYPGALNRILESITYLVFFL